MDDRKRSRRIAAEIRRRVLKTPSVDPITSAEVAGLHYRHDASLRCIRRVGRGKRMRYVGQDGRPTKSRAVLERIRALAIPPAWTDVRICADPNSHLQATGRDARGRKQYRYHPRWAEVRDEVKYGRLIAFAQALPKIRRRTSADLRRRGLPREKVLGTVVQLLEKTLIRVGNDEYARENGSFGLTTMRDGHARVTGPYVHFAFRGKSGIRHRIDLHDARLARVVKKCRDLPGYELFQYVDDEGRRQVIGSGDVNQYLRDIAGQAFTAKDFRTWAGTVLAARALADRVTVRSKRQGTRNVSRAVESVAKQLGNTVAVCRKSYIHPAILDAYLGGRTIGRSASRTGPYRRTDSLSPDEAAVVRILRRAKR